MAEKAKSTTAAPKKSEAETAKSEAAAPAKSVAQELKALADVVDLDAARAEARKEGVAEAKKESAARATAIRQACDLAGCPERFGEFLDSDLTTEQIGKKILDERAAAAGPEIDGHHAGSGAQGEPNIDTAAVYRRWSDASAFARPAKSAS